MQEFIRHRITVIRRRTQFLLDRARRRKHTVEGLLLALADIDEIIRIIRPSSTQAEAKDRLMGVEVPASMMERALESAVMRTSNATAAFPMSTRSPAFRPMPSWQCAWGSW